jgi:hypothetical protein
MKITVTKTVRVEEDLKVENLTVSSTGTRDVDSVNIEICYKGVEIGHGHLNIWTKWAHVTLNEDNQDLEDFLVESIENRTMQII